MTAHVIRGHPLLLLLLVPGVVNAQACNLEQSPVLAFSPSPPTSTQPVLITVGSVTLSPASTFVEVVADTINVTVFGAPKPGPIGAPACTTVGVGPLAAGTYDVNFMQSQTAPGGPVVSVVKSENLVVTAAGRPRGVDVVPAYPVPAHPISIRIRASTPSSPVSWISPHTATRQGNTIRVEGCYRDSWFSVPGTYTATAGVGPLARGRYRVEYHRTLCKDDGTYFGQPKFVASFDFDVMEPGAAWPSPPGPVMPVSEYYHEDFGHYFLTANEFEQAAVESRLFTGWEPVGSSSSWYPPNDAELFGFWREPDSDLVPVCRFFSASFAPKSSHFYTADPTECENVNANPDWQFEGIVGYVARIGLYEQCPRGVPLYRLYNAGKGGAPNHRYTVSRIIKDVMVVSGWQSEETLGCVTKLPLPY